MRGGGSRVEWRGESGGCAGDESDKEDGQAEESELKVRRGWG